MTAEIPFTATLTVSLVACSSLVSGPHAFMTLLLLLVIVHVIIHHFGALASLATLEHEFCRILFCFQFVTDEHTANDCCGCFVMRRTSG